MKHHEYQIYYGGFKIKYKEWIHCKECDYIGTKLIHKKMLENHRRYQKLLKENVGSHKKQTVKPRLSKYDVRSPYPRVISEKN